MSMEHRRRRTNRRPEEVPAAPYAYLLGAYLGDGCLSLGKKGCYRLRISLDVAYPAVVGEVRRAVEAVMPDNAVGLAPKSRGGAVDVSSYSKHWPVLLPQHGS